MYIFLVIVHVIIAIILIASVLLQSGKSAGLSGAIAGGAQSFVGKKKGIDDLLSKVTTVTAILFIVNSILLAVV
ncbi:preprotein translocase subunit SecG [Natranaerofaba carboxydovora]|uniref:preprotein translocase subunit SecG n=1 Tax=Natranaerofaba carboxydovora TaxID=2742683 RepID=UPI001F1477D1|nr:preprotein translocase subunit SecG [Natranaerofaba carboxydovora]UMZ72661.1 putative protein-export membrane protein SecG [Natranaerofaba carboxydovora]